MGIVIGVAGAMALSRALEALLFQISPFDPMTYFTVAALVAIVAALACSAPAWRAAHVDPAATLKG